MEKDELIFLAVVTVSVGLFVLGFMGLLRSFNAATLNTQVINPRPGIECVVVSATDSTSVDCWEALISPRAQESIYEMVHNVWTMPRP